MSVHKFKTNINCGGCIKSVTPFLNQVDSIDEWKVDTENPDRILEVTLDEDGAKSEIVRAVENAGFSIQPA